MIRFNSDNNLFYSSQINDSRYFSGFGTSGLGDARDSKIISGFFNQQNIDYKQLVLLEQIHSINVNYLDSFNPENKTETLQDSDGVITGIAKIALLVRNADCVPLIIIDKKKGVVGISHQGWRGSLKNMSGKMVETFLQHNSANEDLVCAIGPAIGSCCYDVDDDHYYEFLEKFEEYSGRIFSKKKGRWHLSLAQLNYLQLIKAGIKKEKIDFFPFCTKCDSKRFFSRRRAKSANFAEMFNFVMKI